MVIHPHSYTGGKQAGRFTGYAFKGYAFKQTHGYTGTMLYMHVVVQAWLYRNMVIYAQIIHLYCYTGTCLCNHTAFQAYHYTGKLLYRHTATQAGD